MLQPLNFSFLLILLLIIPFQAQAQDFLKDDYTLKLSKTAKDKDYGYTPENPIQLGGFVNDKVRARNYLMALQGPNGEAIKFNRLGSCCAFKSKNALFGDHALLDRYEVTYEGLKEPFHLYINEYDYKTPLCPKGLTFKTEEDTRTIKKADPASIKKVDACSEASPFSVKDFLLKDALGEELSAPDKNPAPKGGLKSLKKYFSEHPLTDDRAKEMIFRVAIGFKVNCKGEAGDYFIATKGGGDLEELANQVLEIANQLDVDWKAATVGDEAVVCYQILSFMVVKGQLSSVSIR